MNVIKFNNTSFEVESYNKNTYFNGETVNSNANCTIKANDMTVVNALAEETITSIEIRHDGEVIYTLSNINAKIESINEYLSGDRMNVSINLTFNMGANE